MKKLREIQAQAKLVGGGSDSGDPIRTNGDKSPTSNGAGKIGRNDPCPCGAIDSKTGQVYKWKKCGMIAAPQHKSK